jgi:hypothetical protein
MEAFNWQNNGGHGVTPPWSVPPSRIMCRFNFYWCPMVVAHAIAIFYVLQCGATWCVEVCWEEDELKVNLN